ncbi:hypothetical protein RI578_09920 [Streptomyces sp. BB1-1-1]|uniref:hypothetical protein n=1 Tax=Streptomyces TaxID=1883 RepID=UPI002877856E|nr:hypothetical protein [Streptomyces sp. BB1-1-1]WND34584.1 hypothetical protein RI578_09920 [Streptomyces sp. BB1-1-1]
MPETLSAHDALDQIAADARSLQQSLRHTPIDCARVLTARVIEAQALAANALHLFLGLELEPSHDSSAQLLRLDRVARTAKAAQDASAELTAALARAVENQRRRAYAATSPPVLLRPTPQQFVASAADLLDGLLTLCRPLRRDHSQPPAALVPAPPAS